MERKLSIEEAASAALIQKIIDEVAHKGGGKVVLPAMELVLDRGLTLRSGIELVGQGEGTVLKKGPGRVYPFSGYHNYGMCDAPLESAAGLEVGMTVSLHDGRTHGGFYETFATITWIDGNWVGLDHGIEADYSAEHAPCLTTAYPLVFGHCVKEVALRDMRLEGNRAEQDKHMGGCRGSSVYFARSCSVEVSGVVERDYHGEGMGFQMCRDVKIIDSRFDYNSGNGLHPGAGSTNALFANCQANGNDKAGFFFCVRANNITVTDCTFRENRLGISIGTSDCYNLIEDCTIENNAGAGVLVRQSPEPVEVHSCRVERCRIGGNAREEGRGQIEVTSAAHDLVFVDNEITGSGGAGIYIEPSASAVFFQDNTVTGCEDEVGGEAQSLVETASTFECGYGQWPETHFRHLLTP
ncbi:MAG: right-handed parallel beta-helix repeat-containing protein [Candidatus Latescibacterota bacterium]|jgi:parallel beta-helix repeat protein